MNIKTRAQFDALLFQLQHEEIMAFDSETNGLSVYLGNFAISFSFYFSSNGNSYNFAFAHGQGQIDIPDENQDTSKFHNWKWTGKGKKQVYKAYWFERYSAENATDFGNVPAEWVDELRDAWNRYVVPSVHVVYYNEPFDVHVCEAMGLRQPKYSEDVRIAVGLVFEDWNHPSIKGNNRLKWQAQKWGVPGAMDGEDALSAHATAFSTRLAEFVLSHWDDPINSSFHALKRPARVDEIVGRVEIDDKAEMWMLPSDEVAEYAENDTRETWELREILRGKLDHFNQWELYGDWCRMQADFLIRMERNGKAFDKEAALKQIEELEPVLDQVNRWFVERIANAWDTLDAETITALTDKHGDIKFTCGSAVKLKIVLQLLTGYEWTSTDKQAIRNYEEQVGEHEAIDKLKLYRHAQRAVSTYLKNWVASVDEQGYIHGSYNASGTKTHRLSSSSGTLGKTGNEQNVPTRGFTLKTCIITPDGYLMHQIDYGQLELRLASWIAGCMTMTNMFESGEDMHAYTRDMVNVQSILFPGLSLREAALIAFNGGKLKLKEWTEDEAVLRSEMAAYCRQVAKTLNFGLLYSGTWRMVNRLLHVGEIAARELHAAWNALYPEFEGANREWTETALSRRLAPDGTGPRVQYVAQPISGITRKFGLYPDVETIYYTRDGETKNFTVRTKERQAKDAFNFAVQGLGGYINSMSSTKLCNQYDNAVFKPFVSIHDSVGFYLRKQNLDELPNILYTICDWPIRPALTADLEGSKDGTWQGLKGIADLDLYIASVGKDGFAKEK